VHGSPPYEEGIDPIRISRTSKRSDRRVTRTPEQSHGQLDLPVPTFIVYGAPDDLNGYREVVLFAWRRLSNS